MEETGAGNRTLQEGQKAYVRYASSLPAKRQRKKTCHIGKSPHGFTSRPA